jgi:hypothetical protein
LDFAAVRKTLSTGHPALLYAFRRKADETTAVLGAKMMHLQGFGIAIGVVLAVSAGSAMACSHLQTTALASTVTTSDASQPSTTTTTTTVKKTTGG